MREYAEHKRVEYVRRGRETLWSSRGGSKGRMGHGISPLRNTPLMSQCMTESLKRRLWHNNRGMGELAGSD